MAEIRYNAGYDSPGPIYHPKTGAFSPYISMSSRNKVRDLEVTPGPGQYEHPTQYNADAERGASMRSRTYARREHYGPGPAAYSQQRQTKTLSPTLGSRTAYPGTMDWALKRVTQTPAGNAYQIPDQRSRNAPSFGQRVEIKQHWPSPGPGKYNTRDIAKNIVRPRSPVLSIREKIKEVRYEDAFKRPDVGPNSYQATLGRRPAPYKGCTFGARGNRGIVVFCY